MMVAPWWATNAACPSPSAAMAAASPPPTTMTARERCIVRSPPRSAREYTLDMSVGISRAVSRALLAGMAGVLGIGGAPATLSAHDVPVRVTVIAFIKPEGQVLRVIVRAPLEAMRDVNFPLRLPGYLE